MDTFFHRAFFLVGLRMVCLGGDAPILALLSLAALLVPMATGKAIYCHQLCPHGAARQWMRKARKQPFQISSKLNRLLECIPYLLLVLVVFLAFQTSAHTLNILEPFDAYVWRGCWWSSHHDRSFGSIGCQPLFPWLIVDTGAPQEPC